jgi:hypothetical protein
MDAAFPFGLPFPTAMYLVFYLGTLVVHIVFMNYVLAGSATLAAMLAGRARAAAEHPVSELLRDWMPFMLSAAITAGIAPLLFLQVLYKEQFYTANLLLFLRWMAILPALILGFYLGYLLKKESARAWPAWRQVALGGAVFACFAFVGWSWVENHLLSLAPAERWREQYVSRAAAYATPELGPRLLLWFVAAFPTMALLVAWQLWDRARREGGDVAPGARAVTGIALGGIVASSLWAVRYYFLLSAPAREAIAGPFGRPYALLSLAGGALELVAWVALLRKGKLSGGWLALASAGLVVNFVGTAVVNETIRLATLAAAGALPALFERHAESWKVGGLPVFLFFFGVNAALMAWCVRRVRRRGPPGTAAA